GIRDFHVTGVQTCALPIYLTNMPFKDAEGNQLWFAPEDHPYWSIENVRNNNEVNRFYGNINLKYDFLEWLSADLKVGADVFSMVSKGFDNKGIRSNGNTSSAGAGGVQDRSVSMKNINSYFTLTANKKVFENWNLIATVGNEIIANNRNTLQSTGLGIVLPDFDNRSEERRVGKELSMELISRSYQKL